VFVIDNYILSAWPICK